ncbi:MAG: immunoglobulin domain-containing protein [Phycisphaerales bacterium]|nr:immunoglobulin domain-containing protein [Phycisphaerales bacterium]
MLLRLTRRDVFCLAAILGTATSFGDVMIVDDSGTARNGKVGGWSSIVAGGGDAAISYYCEDDHAGPNGDMYALRFAWAQGGQWTWVTVDHGGGSDTCMKRGGDGSYRIVYSGSLSGLGLAVGGANTWSLTPVPVPAEMGPGNISMVLDPQDNPHICYYNLTNGGDRSLRYVYFDGANWVEGGANGGNLGAGLWTPTIGFSNTQLALDASGVPHIALAEPTDAINAWGDIKYSTLQGGPNGVWQRESLNILGVDPSLAIGTDGVPRMVFNGDAGIVYAQKAGGSWTFDTIVAGQSGSSLTLALDNQNQAYVSFAMTANEDMYLAQQSGGGWIVAKVDGDSTSDPHVILGRLGTGIDVDESGTVHMSYCAIDIYGMTHRSDLKYYGVLGPPPCIVLSASPAPASVCWGGSAGFDVTASSNGELAYQWQRDGAPLSDGVTPWGSLVSGATSPNLSIVGVADGDVGIYDCVVSTAECASITSGGASLMLDTGAVVTLSPAPVSTCAGASAQFSVSASGGPPLTYAWRKDGVELVDGPTGSGSTVSGAGTAMLSITAVSSADMGAYDCMITNDCGGEPSGAAALTVTTCGELRGDMNCDGVVNNFDIDPFVLALTDFDAYELLFPDCDGGSHGDTNDDGVLNNFDIDPFVNCIMNGGCP